MGRLEDELARETRYKNPWRPNEFMTEDGLGIHGPSRAVIDADGNILQAHNDIERVKKLWQCYVATGARTPQNYDVEQIVDILKVKRFYWSSAGRKYAIRDRLLKIESVLFTAPDTGDMLCELLEEKFPCPPDLKKILIR